MKTVSQLVSQPAFSGVLVRKRIKKNSFSNDENKTLVWVKLFSFVLVAMKTDIFKNVLPFKVKRPKTLITTVSKVNASF